MASEETNRKESIFRRIKATYIDADLDDQVHEVMSLKASAINNSGIDAQLELLAEEAGLEWLEEFYLKAPDHPVYPTCSGVDMLPTETEPYKILEAPGLKPEE